VLAALGAAWSLVHVQNGLGTLGGTLLVPHEKGPHPAVVLIPALEQRKAEMSREDFRFYGDLFARGGFAALLYDQRSFVSPRSAEQGPAALEARSGDALAALELLQRRPEIDPGRIGLWGFELGGIVAPMAAARSKDVAFVIAVSSPGVPYSELPLHALGERLRRMGFSYGDVNDAREAFRHVLEYDRQGGDAELMQRFLDQTRKARWAPYLELPLKAWRPRRASLKCCDQYPDPAQLWEQVDVPVLLVYGTRDHLFAARESADRIEAALARAGNRDVTIKLYDGADHRIQQARWFPSEMNDWLVKKMKAAPAVSR
jgi:dienelactone hydrolase